MKRTFDYKILPWILSIPVSVWFICREIVNFPPDNWYHWIWGGPLLVAGAVLIAWVGFGLIGALIIGLLALVTLFIGWFTSDHKPKTNNIDLTEKEIPLTVVLIIFGMSIFASAVIGYAIIKRGMDPAIPYQAGMDKLSLEEYSDALAHFNEALELKPQYAEAWFRIGQCYWGLGFLEKAVQPYEQAIHIKPDYALAHGHLGGLYAALGRFAKASEVLSEALMLDPEDAGNYACLGECYFQLGHYGRAMELFAQAIRTHSGIAEIMMKPTYINIGTSDEALWYSCVGTAYCEVGRYDLAIKACNQSVSKKPDLPDAHLALGLVYLKQGDKDSALREYEILKTLDKRLANELFDVLMVGPYHGTREYGWSQKHRISWEQLDTWAINEAFIKAQVEKISKEMWSDQLACEKEIHMLLEFVRHMPGVRSYLEDNNDIKIEYRQWLYDQIMSQSDTNSPNSF